MLHAVGRLALGPTELTFGFALERRFRLLSVDRRGLVFDTRFAAPFRQAPRNAVFVYCVLDGRLAWHEGPVFEAPAVFVANEIDFEGANGRRRRTFASRGEPFRAVELRVGLSDWDRPMPAEPSPLSATDAVFSAARVYLHAGHARRGQSEVTSLAKRYLDALAAERIVSETLASGTIQDEGWRGHVWETIRPTIERFAFGTTQDEIAATSGFPTRRLERALARFAETFDVSWGGFRDQTRRYRVRIAVMLLSNPELSVVEIARATGYSSAEALAHALDAEGLPSPTDLRSRIAEAGA
jgi:AraC-like DNA-binding protein